jgi:PPOX class probable F420-dependent enzyme
MPMTNQELNKFLSETHVTVISTVDADNRPRSAPIWYEWKDGAAYLFTGRRTLKWRNIQDNPNVSLCVDWREPPYRSAIIQGTAEEVEVDMYDLVLSMSVRYYGEEKGRAFAEGYRGNDENVVAFRVTPENIASFESDE